MLVHSYIYYHTDHAPLVSDATFDKWANELTQFQMLEHNIGFYDTAFKGWDGSTGLGLPTDNWIMEKAECLIHHCAKQSKNGARETVTQL